MGGIIFLYASKPMPFQVDPLLNNTDKISLSEFKKLLFDLKHARPDIQIRYRLLGENWYSNFVSINALTELDDFEDARKIIFMDSVVNKVIVIKNISDVIQFEIESPFGVYRPHFHYSITLA
ncbi:MAG: hypothetical protein ACOYXT_14165 [Bacteroidota bacterium]